MESSLRRQLLAHADRLFRDAGNLHFEVGRFTKVAAPGNGAQEFPAHLLKLAHAMWTHARTFDPGTEIPDGRQPAAQPEEAVRNATASSPGAATEAAAEQQAQQEEEVLADLIQHYRQSSSVLDWLPAAVFTAGPRRDVYEAITALARDGRPIDELTVEWHLASSRAVSRPRPDLAQAVQVGPPGGVLTTADLDRRSRLRRPPRGSARRGRSGHHDRTGATRTPHPSTGKHPWSSGVPGRGHWRTC